MIWYLIKYNSQGMWTQVSTETSYDSAEARAEALEAKAARAEFLDKKVKNVNYMIVTSPLGKQYLEQVVNYKLEQLNIKAA